MELLLPKEEGPKTPAQLEDQRLSDAAWRLMLQKKQERLDAWKTSKARPKKAGRRITQDEVDEWRVQHQAGMTLQSIGFAAGVHESTVWMRLYGKKRRDKAIDKS